MFKIQASSSLKGWFLGESEAHSALLKPCLVPLKGAPLPPATWLQSQGRWPPYESRIRDRLVELPPSGMFPVGSPPGDIIFIQRWLARSTHTQMCVHTYHSCVSILCIHSMHIYTYIHAHTHTTPIGHIITHYSGEHLLSLIWGKVTKLKYTHYRVIIWQLMTCLCQKLHIRSVRTFSGFSILMHKLEIQSRLCPCASHWVHHSWPLSPILLPPVEWNMPASPR